MKELKLEAITENLYAVQDFIAAGLENIPPKAAMQIALAVEEIFVNIACYAYGEKTGEATIRIAAGNEVVIEFEDAGKPFNPLNEAMPDINAGAQEREIGGLGIFMVKNIMDAVEYRYDDNKNILVIKKNIG